MWPLGVDGRRLCMTRVMFHQSSQQTPSSAGRYVDLAEGGGYIDRLCSTRKATTVRIALFGLRHAFAYVQLAETGLFDGQFCTRVQSKISNWVHSMTNDTRRQRSVHREVKDVVAIALLFPFVDSHWSVSPVGQQMKAPNWQH